METKTFKTDWAGRPLIIETGKLAQQASGSCTVQYGNTMVLATCVVADKPSNRGDFLPLSIAYEEKLYAAGKIKGSRWVKREGRPTDDAVTTGRMIDRGIRPLIDDRIRHEIQVIVTVLSYDNKNTADIVSTIAASTAISLSNLPWDGPIAGVRVGRKDGEFIVNPEFADREELDLNMVLSGTVGRVTMLDGDGKESSEEDSFKAIKLGMENFAPAIELIKQVEKEVGKEKMSFDFNEDDEIKDKVIAYLEEKAPEIMYDSPKILKADRNAVKTKLSDMLADYLISLGVEDEDEQAKYIKFVDKVVKATTSKYILDKDQRLDGRAMDEIRELKAEVDLLPHNHGSGLFSRGETQVLSVLTLGSPGDVQMIETMEEEGKRHYFHHYNFPPYSVGETGRIGSPGRREIGHGALAEKALIPVLPSKDDFPYTIRTVSEVLGSNGSSSMASACASTLSLMAAGVPIKSPVAGLAIGLASEEDEQGNFKRAKVFTDLQDVEDGDGGMDFKVTGTRNGITAIQMDTKTHGLTPEIMIEAFAQAKAGRLEILDVIEKAIPAPRETVAEFAPRIFTIKIDPDKIRDVIGKGGETINKIIDETGVAIDIEDDGSVFITAEDGPSAEEAKKWIEDLTKEVEVGEIYDGKVVKIMDFGAFVQLIPGTDGLLHVSEISHGHTSNVGDVLKEGQTVKVKVIRKDPSGKISLSAKALQKKPEFKPRRADNPKESK